MSQNGHLRTVLEGHSVLASSRCIRSNKEHHRMMYLECWRCGLLGVFKIPSEFRLYRHQTEAYQVIIFCLKCFPDDSEPIEPADA